MPVVVVAEIESVIRLDIAALLEDLGHEVVEADSAEAVLKALDDDNRQVALLIASIELRGEMDGLRLLEEAKRRQPGVGLILSTARSRGEIDGALPEGVVYMPKPFVRPELEKAVNDALS